MSAAFFKLTSTACQFLMEQGLFVADVCLITTAITFPISRQLKKSDPAKISHGYDLRCDDETAVCDGTRVEAVKNCLPTG